MTSKTLIALLLGLLIAGGAHAHGEASAAQHGGQVVEAGDYYLEWVAGDGIYLTDHDGAEVATEGASGKAIVISGAAKATVSLVPAGGNRLKFSENPPEGAQMKAVISITLPGKPPVQARFEAVPPGKQ